MNSALINPSSIRFTVRTRDGYGDVTDYNAIVDGEWSGIVSRCTYVATEPGSRYNFNRSSCTCGKWHGVTWAIGKGSSMPGHPTVNVLGMSTRADTARALAATRAGWDLIRPYVSDTSAYAEVASKA